MSMKRFCKNTKQMSLMKDKISQADMEYRIKNIEIESPICAM